MKKLMLDAAELRVQSFTPGAAQSAREGTVHAMGATPACTDPPWCGTQARALSCYSSCTDIEFCG